MQEWKYETHRFIKTQMRWTQASKIHCTSTADLIKTVIHCTSREHDEPRTRSNPEHDSLHKPSKPILRVLHRSNPEHDEGSQTHQNRRPNSETKAIWIKPMWKKIKPMWKKNQYSLNGSSHQPEQLIKWIYPLPINPWFIFLKPSWEDQNSETKNVNPCEKKKKIKPIKRSNPTNGTDQPIHQANANQTH